MQIRFISSLTAENENQVAPALLKAVGVILDQLPIAYTVRIQTMGAQVFQHTHTYDASSTLAVDQGPPGSSRGDCALDD